MSKSWLRSVFARTCFFYGDRRAPAAHGQQVVRATLVVVGILIFASFGARIGAAEVVLADGTRFTASLIEVAKDGQVTFDEGEKRRTIPLVDVVTYGAMVDPTRGVQVLLTDGGLIVADSVRTEKEKLAFDSAVLGEHAMPLEFVAGIIFQPPQDVQECDRLLNRVRAPTARSDRLLLANLDELAGSVDSIADSAISIDVQGQKLPVEIDRVAAAAFDPTLAAQRPAVASPRTLVGLRDGSRLIVNGLTTDQKQAQLTLADSAVYAVPIEAVTFLQPLGGRAIYLSDLKAESYRHLPFLTTAWDYQNDANVTGTQLRASGHLFSKGLGMHSAGRLTYRLDKRYRTFEADVALDDQVGRGGSVVFAIYVDDKLAWKSDVIRGGVPPVPVKVDVTGGTRLSLLVDFAERGDELDRANWLNARLFE